MRKVLCLGVAFCLLAAVLSGCAQTGQTVRDNRRTAIGAGAGAVGGALVGGLVGGKRGAVVGGLLGALAGGVVGHYYDEREKTLAQTSRDYGYTASQGTHLKIEAVRVNPAALAPGQTININLTYAVLVPAADQQIPVRETREILVNGTSVGKTSIDISREGGTWKSTVPVTLPANAAAGNYRVVASVETRGGDRDVKETFFKVRP